MIDIIGWRDSISIPEEYKTYREALIKMTELPWNISDGHLASMNIATHRIKIIWPYIQRKHFIPCNAESLPEVRESEKKEIERMMEVKLIESA